MDAANLFETPATYRAMRAEYGLLAAASAYLLWRRRKEVRWPLAVGLFLYNDTLGYVPGAIAYRLSSRKRIAKGYYGAHNLMPSAMTGAVVAGVPAKLIRPEWALLGTPFPIGIDRAAFGNFLKPFSVPFEPHPHPVWAQVRHELFQPWAGVAPAQEPTVAEGSGHQPVSAALGVEL